MFQFDKSDGYDATEKAYGAAATLAGPHRYGNRNAQIFVQCNSGLSADHGAAVKKIVDAL